MIAWNYVGRFRGNCRTFVKTNVLAMFQTTLKSRVDEDFCLLVQPLNLDFHCIVDCGQASDLSVSDCRDALLICISHTHIDHFINFDTLIRHQIGTGKRYVVVGPKGIAQNVQGKLKGYLWNLIQADAVEYEIREIDENGDVTCWLLIPPLWELTPLPEWKADAIFTHPKFEVEYCLLDHKTPVVAYLFRAKDTVSIDMKKSPIQGGPWVNSLKNAFENGQPEVTIPIGTQAFSAGELFHLLDRKLGYRLGVVMDHAASPENHQKISDFLGGADEVFIEAFYKASDQPNAEANAHSYSRASGEIMRKSGVRKAVPVHFSRRYDASDIQELTSEFEEAFQDS